MQVKMIKSINRRSKIDAHKIFAVRISVIPMSLLTGHEL
jgi:hypothetical protein